jgi:hypothetical protein
MLLRVSPGVYVDNSNNTLRYLNASISYIYDKTWSFTAGWSISGVANAVLYGTLTGKPDSIAAHAVEQIRRRHRQYQRRPAEARIITT